MNLEYEAQKKRKELEEAKNEEARELFMIRMYLRFHKMKMKERAAKLLDKYRSRS